MEWKIAKKRLKQTQRRKWRAGHLNELVFPLLSPSLTCVLSVLVSWCLRACVCVFVCVAVGDRVEVRSQYYPEQSNPLKDQYIFVYKVKITNHSSQTIQLVSRTWEIKAIEATEVCTMC